MKTITATVPAWFSHAHLTMAKIESQSAERSISDLTFWASHNADGTGPDCWLKVGTAEITVTFDDPEQITGSQISMLKAAKRKVQADCEVALNQIEGQIQSLLAIESK